MNVADRMGLMMVKLLVDATAGGNARAMPMVPLVVRVKRGKKMGVRDGGYAYANGRVLIALPDEAILNLKGSEDAMDMWILARIKRATANELLGEGGPQIVRPRLVGPDGVIL